jgi:uncharacterized protein YijF (DUF1287 family)
MAKKASGYYRTIEYIGPRPQKPKRPNFFGGWVILVISAGIAVWFVKPLVPFLRAAQAGASSEQANLLIAALDESARTGDRLAAAALAHAQEQVSYDPAYYNNLAYPGGDVPPNKGVAADVIVRCLRKVGFDLQELVHEDMAENFREYPQLWSAAGPDTNIDHRRVPNLEKFLMRTGAEIALSRDPADYLPGDIVVWTLANGQPHIGLVVPGPAGRSETAAPWIVHNHGAGVKWENVLFDYEVAGHFRFPVGQGKE